MVVHYQKAIEALSAGERLMFTHKNPNKESEKSFYSLIPSGKTVSARAVMKLRDSGLIAPIPDGLFGDEMSQTFGLKSQ
jgi:hypothetical protein